MEKCAQCILRFLGLGHQGLFGSSCVKHRGREVTLTPGVVLSGVRPPEFSFDCCMAGSFVCGLHYTHSCGHTHY